MPGEHVVDHTARLLIQPATLTRAATAVAANAELSASGCRVEAPLPRRGSGEGRFRAAAAGDDGAVGGGALSRVKWRWRWVSKGMRARMQADMWRGRERKIGGREMGGRNGTVEVSRRACITVRDGEYKKGHIANRDKKADR